MFLLLLQIHITLLWWLWRCGWRFLIFQIPHFNSFQNLDHSWRGKAGWHWQSLPCDERRTYLSNRVRRRKRTMLGRRRRRWCWFIAMHWNLRWLEMCVCWTLQSCNEEWRNNRRGKGKPEKKALCKSCEGRQKWRQEYRTSWVRMGEVGENETVMSVMILGPQEVQAAGPLFIFCFPKPASTFNKSKSVTLIKRLGSWTKSNLDN